MSTKEIAEMPDQRTVTIVCVNEPTRVLKTLGHQFHFEPTDEAGIYRSDHLGLNTWIIHPSELTLEPRNYPLLPLAKNEKLKQFINLCLAENLVDFLRLTLDIGLITQPDALWQKIREVMNMKLTIKEETWPYIDEFFREIPEAIQKIPTIQEAVAVKQAAEQAAKQAVEQATKQGLEQSSRETLLNFVRRYLEKQLAMPEVDFEETLQALKLDALNQLSEHLFDLETPDETKNYLTELLAQQAHAEMSS